MHYFQTNWKDFTVAYMIPNFEMIRLHLDKEDSLLFSFFFFFFFIWNITHKISKQQPHF